MKTAGSVDEYIKNAPEDVQAKLREMRDSIKLVAPEAVKKAGGIWKDKEVVVMEI